MPIPLPPLRERREDIAPLAKYFVQRYAEVNRRDVPELTNEVMNFLQSHDWPGNVRELENTIERLIVLSPAKAFSPELLSRLGRPKYALRSSRPRGDDVQGLISQLVKLGTQQIPTDRKLHETLVGGLERALIEHVMRLNNGIQIKAAAQLKINRNTLHKKIEEFKKQDQGGIPTLEEPENGGPDLPAERAIENGE